MRGDFIGKVFEDRREHLVGNILKMRRLLAAAGKQKTYRCDTCNKTFTSQVGFLISPESSGNFVLFFTCHDFISPLFRLYSSSTSVCGGSRVVVSGGTCNSLEKLILGIFHSIVANILPHVNLFQFQVDEM